MLCVSIILPTIGRPTLGRALESLLMQQGLEFEVVVVASGSSAASLVLPARLPMLGDPRVRILSAPHTTNAAAARNVGLDAARGEWICFLDDDDAYAEGKIARQHALALASGAAVVLCGGRFHLRGRMRVRGATDAMLAGDDLLTGGGMGSPFLFHRREPQVRFDETLDSGEDADYAQGLFAQFDLRSVPVVAAPLVEVFQDQGDAARTNLRADAGWRAARKIWWRYGKRYSRNGRRLFHIQSRLNRLKLRGETKRLVALLPALFRYGGAAQVRFALNAVLVSSGLARGRFVT